MTRRFKTAKKYVADCLLYYTEDVPEAENYTELLTILGAIEKTANDCRHYIYEQVDIERKKNG